MMWIIETYYDEFMMISRLSSTHCQLLRDSIEIKYPAFNSLYLVLHPHPKFVHLCEILKYKFHSIHHIAPFPAR